MLGGMNPCTQLSCFLHRACFRVLTNPSAHSLSREQRKLLRMDCYEKFVDVHSVLAGLVGVPRYRISTKVLVPSPRSLSGGRQHDKVHAVCDCGIQSVPQGSGSKLRTTAETHACVRLLTTGAALAPTQSTREDSVEDLMQPEVRKMLNGESCDPKPVRNWRKCPLIQASRRSEFRPLTDGAVPEIRPLPENVRASLNGCMSFQSQQIAGYNELLRRDGKLVSGVDKVAARERTKPGRLYHKFDGLCALAASKSSRLLLVQHRELHHVFYAIRFDPAHALYAELLNMYERRWFTCSSTYGKVGGDGYS